MGSCIWGSTLATQMNNKFAFCFRVCQSLTFFLDPDEDHVIECLDGSAKYEPITAGDYIKHGFARDFD